MREYDIILYYNYKDIDHIMGYQDSPQENLFQYHIYLDNRVRGNHALRKTENEGTHRLRFYL